MRKADERSPSSISQQLIARARELRKTATSAEDLLWQLLRSRQLHSCKFRRQHPLGTFIADFFCDDVRLIIEIDGAVHQEPTQQIRDDLRTEVLEQYNLIVLRFTNEEVFQHIDQVIETISSYLSIPTNERINLPLPSPAAWERGRGEGHYETYHSTF